MTDTVVFSANQQNSFDLKCPNCGSSKIIVDKKGFSTNNACCGWIICGPIGGLFGSKDSNKLMGTCMNCGEKFDAMSQVKERRKLNSQLSKQKKNESVVDIEEKTRTIEALLATKEKTMKIETELVAIEKRKYEEQVAKEKGTKFCTQCGQSLLPDADYCSKCGLKVIK